MKTQGNGGVRAKRQKVVLICLGVGCVVVYAVWGAQVAKIIDITRHRTVTEVDQAKFDFGKVAAGSETSHTFVLRNTGRDTINIRKLISSCACTAVVLSKKQIAPKKETRIEIVLRTAGYLGKLNKKCFVLFEQEDVMPVTLEVVADIYSTTANFSVNRLYFDKVVAGTEVTKTVAIIQKKHLDERFKITDVKSSSDIIKVYVDNQKGELRCTLDSHAPVGFIDEKISLIMNGPKGTSNVEIPVAGRVVNPYELNPERIFLGRLEKRPKQRVQKIITITSLKGGIPADFDLTIENENVSLKLNSRGDKCVVCSVEFNPSQKSGFFEGELLIKTNSTNTKGREILRVPYSGYCILK